MIFSVTTATAVVVASSPTVFVVSIVVVFASAATVFTAVVASAVLYLQRLAGLSGSSPSRQLSECEPAVRACTPFACVSLVSVSLRAYAERV